MFPGTTLSKAKIFDCERNLSGGKDPIRALFTLGVTVLQWPPK